MQRPEKGSLNEMKFDTQINLVILNMMVPFIFNLKIPVILSPIWSRKFTENVLVAPS